MNLYIGKRNLLRLFNFLNQEVEANENRRNSKYEDCLRKFNIFYDFEKAKDDIENIDIDSLKIYKGIKHYIAAGRNNDEESHYKNENLKTEAYPNEYSIEAIKGNKEYLSSVYLVEDYEEGLENIVLCGKPGEETKVLDRLFCGNSKDFYQFHFLPNFSWDDLGDVPPCSDIVICDRFLFSYDDKKSNKTQDVVDYNIKLMFKSLTKNTRGSVNIVVFMDQNTLFLKKDNETQNEKEKRKLAEAERIDKVKKIIEETVTNNGAIPQVTIVANDANEKGPHDRVIIMNYRILISGDSFIYFDKSNNNKSKGFYLISGSLVENNIYDFANKTLDDLSKLYTDKKTPRCRKYGEGKSNLIKDIKKNFIEKTPITETQQTPTVVGKVEIDERNTKKEKNEKKGTYHTGKNGKSAYIEQEITKYKSDVRAIADGEKLQDNDKVSYTLDFEIKDNGKKFYIAIDVRKLN